MIKDCVVCGKPISKEKLKWNTKNRIIKYCSTKCVNNRPREHGYDHTFLDTMTPFAAYFIGWFVADGHKSKKKRVTLVCVDEQLIDDVVFETGYTNNVFTYDDGIPTHKLRYTLSFQGNVSKRLTEMGFPNGPKTAKEFIPDCITDELFPHFLRGLIDGDGCFHILKDDRLTLDIVSMSKKLLTQTYTQIKKNVKIRQGSIRTCNNNGLQRLAFSHTDSLAIGKYIYANNGVKLNRKYDKYLKGKERKLLLEQYDGELCSIEGCDAKACCRGMCETHYSRASIKEWREKNPERHLAYKKVYRQSHKQEINEYKKQYRKDSPELHKAADKRKYEKNKVKISKQTKEYYKTHQEEKLEYATAYRDLHREEIRRKDRERYQKNKEARKAARMAYYEKNKDEINKKLKEKKLAS